MYQNLSMKLAGIQTSKTGLAKTCRWVAAIPVTWSGSETEYDPREAVVFGYGKTKQAAINWTMEKAIRAINENRLEDFQKYTKYHFCA